MSSIDLARIRVAIEDGVAARSAYYAAIDLADEQALGDSAKEAALLSFEKWIGRRLPDSYRSFLALANGWRMVDGGVDLLSLEQMMSEEHRREVLEWKSEVSSRGDEWVQRCLLIGASHVTPTRYLLDPDRVNRSGEWLFIQFHSGVEAEIESFGLWLEESAREYRELASTDPQDLE